MMQVVRGNKISETDASALRAVVKKHVKDAGHGSVSKLAKSFGDNIYYPFMSGKRVLRENEAERLKGLIGVKTSQRMNGSKEIHAKRHDTKTGVVLSRGSGKKPGRLFQYLSDAEGAKLRAEVLRFIDEHFDGGFGKFCEARGFRVSYLSRMMHGHGRWTAELAKRVRKAMGETPAPESAEPLMSQPISPSLREDVAHVLAARFDGHPTQLAHQLGLTTKRLDRFLDGANLTAEEAAQVQARLSTLGTSKELALVPPFPGMVTEVAPDAGAQARAQAIVHEIVHAFGMKAIRLVFEMAVGGGSV